MSLVVIDNGIVIASFQTPRHDDTYHSGNAKRNVASGVAGIDVNQIPLPSEWLSGVEEYDNHSGAVDNFTQTAAAGNATATTNAALHRMDLTTGTGAAGSTYFATNTLVALGTRPLIARFMITAIVSGVGVDRHTYIGFVRDFTLVGPINCAAFHQKEDNTWEVVTANATQSTATAITAPTNTQVLTIVATSVQVDFYVDTSLVVSSAGTLPTLTMYAGAGVIATAATVSTARTVSIDYIGRKRFH